MRAYAPLDGVHSLAGLAARASCAHLLDLHGVARDAVADPDHRARPIFTHPALNRTLIVKHHPRPGEFGASADRGAIVTKVIFPFDPGDLDLGGQALFVDEADLVEQLERRLDYRRADLCADVTVLRLLDRLPTLDPFLRRDAFAANRIEAASCYFRLGPADRAEMLDFAARQAEALIGLCLGGVAVPEAQARRLAVLILADGDGAELLPLRTAMRMTAPEFAAAMFCWRSVLYRRWRWRVLGPEVRATRRALATFAAAGFGGEAGRRVSRLALELETLIADCERRIADMFRLYDGVFAALTAQKTPEPFRRFLIEGPTRFGRVGERMARLEQLAGGWRRQFPGPSLRQIAPEAVARGLRSLLAALALDADLLTLGPDERGVIWSSEDLDVHAIARPRPALQAGAR